MTSQAVASAAALSQNPQALPPPMQLNILAKPPTASTSDWSLEEDSILENTLAEWWNAPDRLDKVARKLPMRSLEQVKLRFALLETDITNIEAGRIPLPNYASAQEHTSMERRKGIPWTEEEHRLFLMGLAKFGKGDWRSISRNYVISRTPTQVASHAQKYFIRLNSLNKKDKRRSSIHDITSPAGAGLAQQGSHHTPGQHVQSGPMLGGLAPGIALPHRPMSNLAPARPPMPHLQPHHLSTSLQPHPPAVPLQNPSHQ